MLGMDERMNWEMDTRKSHQVFSLRMFVGDPPYVREFAAKRQWAMNTYIATAVREKIKRDMELFKAENNPLDVFSSD